MVVRAPQLHETLRAFALGTFRALLADIERGAELQFAFEEHTTYAKPALYEYRPPLSQLKGRLEPFPVRLHGPSASAG